MALVNFSLKYVIVLASIILLPSLAWAQSATELEVSQTNYGPQIEFLQGEYILSQGLDVPGQGWEPKANPNIYRMNETGWRAGDYHTLVGRFSFDHQVLGPSPLAIFTVSTRNNFIVSVNGAEVFRNYASLSDENTPWYRPFLIPLPAGVLKEGKNEIVFKAVSQESVGIGRVIIGPNPALLDYYKSRFFWQITAPKAANFAMLLLGFLVFLFWLGRRQEVALLWLSISTVFWFVRNYQFFAETALFNVVLYNTLPIYATYFAAVSSAAFYFYFINLPSRNKIISGMFLAAIPLMLIHAMFFASDFIIYIPTTLIVFCVAALGFFDLRRNFNIEHGVLAVGMMMTPLATLYDLYIATKFGGDGNAVYLAVFGGFFYATAFIISFGKRILDAFTALGNSNTVLEKRIGETRAELAISETERQRLVVAQAIADERGRLMQEMHDGIGSNLITALAVARQQNQPKATIKTLNRAINDLKITVDSLEPIEGDLVALIGNLRHRMAGDLLDAGIMCKWEVEECGPLTWLDASNALHILRIYNEAISNVLTHSKATEMRIGCIESYNDGAAGISAFVSDNGVGFDTTLETPGRGLSNMRARAKALRVSLVWVSKPSEGTTITLWLPYFRETHNSN